MILVKDDFSVSVFFGQPGKFATPKQFARIVTVCSIENSGSFIEIQHENKSENIIF